MNVELKFQISDTVLIEELKLKGRVVAVFIGYYGVQYQIRYFYNGKVNTIYFFESELSLSLSDKAEQQLGFKK